MLILTFRYPDQSQQTIEVDVEDNVSGRRIRSIARIPDIDAKYPHISLHFPSAAGAYTLQALATAVINHRRALIGAVVQSVDELA